MCSLNNSSGRSFGPSGCQVPVGKGVCGETKTLDIINEFKRLYEEKMQDIDSNGGGDCLQEKFRLQQEWIDDLTKQNEMLVRAVEELEHEATERVQMLEEKLHQSAQCICEVMKRYREYDVTNDLLDAPLKRVFNLENDKTNLLEFIRRVREEKLWSVDGLKFYEVTYQNLLGEEPYRHRDEDERYFRNDGFEVQKQVEDNECTIGELQRRIDYYNSFGDVEALAKELKCKNEECQSLKQSMGDMRQALTEEVATKHDAILQLKRDYQQLEDRCIQADKQTAFRDDIIKELRREIKQLKQQVTQEEIVKLNETIDELQNTLHQTKQLQEDEEQCKNKEISNLNNTIQQLRRALEDSEAKFQKQAKMCKICRERINVGFKDNTQVQTNLSEKDLESQMNLVEKRDEIIKVQNDTVSMLQDELQSLKLKEAEVRLERDKRHNVIQQLKVRVAELETALHDSEEKAANLQVAVDLHLNSINVLEASEEKYKIEVHQQKATISNLQEALVGTKQMLDDMKQKSEENVSLGWTTRWFGSAVANSNQKDVHDI